jgi:DNA polymerase-3 subunit epsilon
MAFILESIEIRRLWPEYNSSQKHINANFGLYLYEDRNGYSRLAIDKQRKNVKALYTFDFHSDGHRLLQQLIRRFNLCPKLCFMQTDNDPCIGLADESCHGACELREPAAQYNLRVNEAVIHLEHLLPSFAVMDEGHDAQHHSYVLIEKGKFYGMGNVPANVTIQNPEILKAYITPYPENEYIRGLVYQYVAKRPENKIDFKA